MASGDAGRWTGLRNVLVAPREERGSGRPGRPGRFEVEGCRAYGDRLVLKLRGVDDPSAASALRGGLVLAPADQVPPLPSGTHYVARLAGLEVQDPEGNRLGRVEDVLPTGGTDVLVVRDPDGAELLIPMAAGIVISIEEPTRIVVQLPEGLREDSSGRETRR